MKIVFLISQSETSIIVFNSFKKRFKICAVIQEESPSKFLLIKRRIKKLGWFKTFGQLLFISMIPPLLKNFSKKRLKEIYQEFHFDNTPIEYEKYHKVNSVNAKETKELLVNLNPDLIIVNGTRIISEDILSSINGTFVNIHVGITPKYRGVHGGYWALASGDKDLFGVTVHLVNKGIDTGKVLYQTFLKASKKDNFSTYPFLQTAAATDLLSKVVEDKRNGTLKPYNVKELRSKLWYHPTLFEYVYNAIKRGAF